VISDHAKLLKPRQVGTLISEPIFGPIFGNRKLSEMNPILELTPTLRVLLRRLGLAEIGSQISVPPCLCFRIATVTQHRKTIPEVGTLISEPINTNLMKPEIYKDEGYQLMGAAFEVYNNRGYGMAEEIYQECMEIELELRGIAYDPKQELVCSYKGRELKKRYVPDLRVFGCLIVELKAVTELAAEHEAQLYNYLRITRQPVGYLINFGHKDTLEWQRITLSEFISPGSDFSAGSD